MLRKTLRIGGRRTSIRLEKAFWQVLGEIAAKRKIRLVRLITEIARGRTNQRDNLASTLRVFALKCRQEKERERGEIFFDGSGNTEKLLDVNPLPCLLLDHERKVRYFNPSFTERFGFDRAAIFGLMLEQLLVVRSANDPDISAREAWEELAIGILSIAHFRAIHIAPGKDERGGKFIAARFGGDGFVLMFSD